MEIYTIGFTQTTAERFFGRLAELAYGSFSMFASTTLRNWRASQKRRIFRTFSTAGSARHIAMSHYLPQRKSCSMSTRSGRGLGYLRGAVYRADGRSKDRGQAVAGGLHNSHRPSLQRGDGGALPPAPGL
jgi:hypothetical protein